MSQSSNNEFIPSIFFAIVALGLIAAIEVSILTLMYGSATTTQVSNTASGSESVDERIKPVVTLADIRGGNDTQAVAPVAAVKKTAKELYDVTCMACHANAVAGAPKPGDKAVWEARFANGFEGLLTSVKNGKGAMPPKGGSAYSDAELSEIIEYMLDGTDLMTAKAAPAAEEMAPVETAMPTHNTEEVVEVSASDIDLAAGEKAYRSACFACHDFGIAGAPKLGDAAGWESRKALGLDELVKNAINGKGGMPPKGGAAYLSDSDVKNIVGFMLSKI